MFMTRFSLGQPTSSLDIQPSSTSSTVEIGNESSHSGGTRDSFVMRQTPINGDFFTLGRFTNLTVYCMSVQGLAVISAFCFAHTWITATYKNEEIAEDVKMSLNSTDVSQNYIIWAGIITGTWILFIIFVIVGVLSKHECLLLPYLTFSFPIVLFSVGLCFLKGALNSAGYTLALTIIVVFEVLPMLIVRHAYIQMRNERLNERVGQASPIRTVRYLLPRNSLLTANSTSSAIHSLNPPEYDDVVKEVKEDPPPLYSDLKVFRSNQSTSLSS